jgi:predicted transcriptional regulator
MPPQPGIGRAELEILQYIQDHHPITVREVAEHLASTKGHTRTTALNLMESLRAKGYLVREKLGGVYHYSPSEPKPELQRSLVRDFVQRVLGGSLEPFMTYLTEEAEVSDEQLEDLKKFISTLEEQKDRKP